MKSRTVVPLVALSAQALVLREGGNGVVGTASRRVGPGAGGGGEGRRRTRLPRLRRASQVQNGHVRTSENVNTSVLVSKYGPRFGIGIKIIAAREGIR